MAASMLHAVGLPQLITESLNDYAALATALARDPSRLQSLRHTLERNRMSGRLFDTARFTRHLEAAYARMWDTWQRGGGPKAVSVAPIA
jgi:protein O-GlcNAc transferase